MEVAGDGLGLAFEGLAGLLYSDANLRFLRAELRLAVMGTWRGRVATDKEPGNLTKTDKAGCQAVVETA